MINTLKMLVASGLLATATAAGAQYASSGYEFLKSVRERDGAKVVEMVGSGGPTILNFRDDKGESALHVVTARRDSEYLGYFLGRKADPNVQDRKGDTPLMLAARSGFVEGIDVLLRVGARVDQTNRAGETALIGAVQQRQAAAVRRLLEAGANADLVDNATGRSARDYARMDTRNTELLRLIETVKGGARKEVAGPKL